MSLRLLVLGAAALLVAMTACPVAGAAAPNTSPPASPVKLVFIHHSTGQAWLEDGHGGLGVALRDNNYFVSDTNYGGVRRRSATPPTSATGGPGSAAGPRRRT